MKNKLFLNKVIKELKNNIDSAYKKRAGNFFKEPIDFIGVRTPVARKIGRQFYGEYGLKELAKNELFDLCEDFLKNKKCEPRLIALQWASGRMNELEKGDFDRMESWAKKYIHNWAHCDDFGTHLLGVLIFQEQNLLSRLDEWARSRNRWLRRLSAISLIYGVKQQDKKFLQKAFIISDKLLLDQDDLVQKGYGWTLKEGANFWPEEVFGFVLKRKDQMPRTALRYAIEKMPKNWKKQAMS